MAPRAEWSNPDMIEWLGLDPAEFSRSIKGTALSRSKRSGLLRNAALILGTRRVQEAVPVLLERLEDADPIVRDAAAWALERIGVDPAAREAGRRALEIEGGTDQALGV